MSKFYWSFTCFSSPEKVKMWNPYFALSLSGFSVIPSSHGIGSIPTTRYWCCQNTEIPWLLGIEYRPLGIPKISRLRWIPPNHKNRGMMYTDHRYKTPDTATLGSGCLLFGPHTIHYRKQHVVTKYLWVCQSIIRALEVLPTLAKGALTVFLTK